jgi:RNA polymerase sigma-70 factor (ECF subfamily)
VNEGISIVDLPVNTHEQGFIDLISTHQRLIHKVCSMYCDLEEERRDLFQEVVLQLWRAYDSYRGQAKLSTWIYRIALNTAITGFRKQTRRPQLTPLSDSLGGALPSYLPDHETEEKRTVLYQAIAQLSEIEKAIVMLHLEDHSYEEIADIMGITRNHVGVKLNRIKEKLRKIMVPHFS